MLEKKGKEWKERYIQEKKMYEREIQQLRIEIKIIQKEMDKLKEEVARFLFQTIEFHVCFSSNE